MKTKNKANPSNHRVALVLQGGGAMGAYQAGVYQALHEYDLAPDWVVGTSIGAINAAIIAGNHRGVRLARLKEFWHGIAHPDLLDMRRVADPMRKFNTWLATADATMRGVPGFFVPRPLNPFCAGLPVPPEAASFYDTRDLAATLEKLVDFPYLNTPGGMRLTVNAMRVTTGALASFDSQSHALGIEHILASGALPPGFPPVRIDGELYWDGGLFSNTPLETVLDEEPQVDTLCFMVDLWSAKGPEPHTLEEVQTRQKDVMYASRSRRHIDNYLRTHQLRRIARALYNQLPPESKHALPPEDLAAIGTDTTMHIVRLVYAGRDWHMASKDINFSLGSIEWRWEQGYRDATRAIEHAGWTSFVPAETGVIVHELTSERASK
ncbi:MAG TPA: patatin-like phospholipase family protein [Burkholderiaceae bacterium]|nr:patatin-like phospholipase family protein [Burkholderiaceae bacterium]